MDSSQPPSPPEGPAAPLPPAALWRKLLWLFLVVTGVVPAVLAATFALLRLGSRLPVVGESLNGSPLAVGAGLLVATVAVVLGVRTGLRRDWPARTHQLLLLGALTAAVGGTVAWGLRDVQRASSASAVQSRLAGIRAAAQQYFLETGTFFVTQDELVGPDRYLRSLNPVVGEDYRPLFPLRLDHVERLRVTLPDGRVIALEYEDPPPDGVQVVELNSWRLETTYRSGWPDGSARVRDQAGRLLSEAEYVAGHLVGPCWVFRDGARIDLNSPANRPPDVLAREQLAAGDFAGAEPQFTRALALTDTAELREGRGDARRGLGRGDDAITDYEVALRLDPGSPRRAGIRDKLEPLFRERSARLRARGDAAGAAAAEAAAERVQLPRLDEQAGARMHAQDHAGAAALSSRAIELEPSPGRHLRRAQARYELGDLDGSLADLDAVIRLSSGPPQLHHLNRAYLRRLKDDRPGAAADLRAVVRHGVGNVNFRGEACHAACWLFLFESEDGRGEAAAAELAQTVAAVDRLGPSEQVWFRAAADLLLGRLQEEQLMARVAALTGPSGETIRFQALFYAAMLRRRAGDTPGAIGLFHRALQNPYARQFQPEWQECRRAVAAPGEQPAQGVKPLLSTSRARRPAPRLPRGRSTPPLALRPPPFAFHPPPNNRQLSSNNRPLPSALCASPSALRPITDNSHPITSPPPPPLALALHPSAIRIPQSAFRSGVLRSPASFLHCERSAWHARVSPPACSSPRRRSPPWAAAAPSTRSPSTASVTPSPAAAPSSPATATPNSSATPRPSASN